MATYINYGEGEDDAMVQGAEWLQHLLQVTQGPDAEKLFKEKFQAIHTAQQEARQYNHGPIFDLLVDYSEGLFTAIPENRPEERLKEIESFFALVLSMLLLLEDTEHLSKATTRQCELFSSAHKPDQQPELRLRLLMMLYNTFNNPTFEFRYRVFKYALDYAAKAELFDQILPYLEFLDSWMVDWKAYLTVDDKRALYFDISTYLRALGKKVDAFTYLKQYHQLFKGESAENMSKKQVQDATIQLIKDAVQLPAVIQFDDILVLDTVKELGKTKQDGLVKLCEVFYSGDVKSLQDFQKKNEALFKEHELVFEDAMAKMRLLTLATVAHGRSELSLEEVASSLDESPDNVERWVVRAISEGVLDGRIDQLNRKVLVKSAFQRKFDTNEWAFLDGKLSCWIENLEHVIKFIGEQKVAK
eukprot:CAMPEP_0115090088 /NCGR_PEP_ID=MMETSP0227-20121206/25166_1 /TAXON_ID=89957 /ORGANISM="Polarella glacialis, Strain CCMP 1383" /LENGTH=415 /DNA_ID=CAMNT_0002481057 /DNA_START=132 /DNA_END=1379 /DNA_ORIENTATION=+